MSNLSKILVTLKSGDERLILSSTPIKFSLLNFWQWYTSDILSNATRGVFAEFIIATATGIDINVPREEWSAFDLTTPDGIKLEIKSSAFLQSWHQHSLSKISFSIKSSLYWDSQTNMLETIAKRQAEIYVFCLLHHEDKSTVDPLNLDQWEFYVLATKQLNEYTGSKNIITLKSLKTLTSAISYNQINEEIKLKHKLNSLIVEHRIADNQQLVENKFLLPQDHYKEFFNCKDDKQYFDWMRANLQAFITNGELNLATKKYVIHKSGCWHIADENPIYTYTFNGNLKICSNDLKDVIEWLSTNRPNGNNYRPCGRCKPY